MLTKCKHTCNVRLQIAPDLDGLKLFECTILEVFLPHILLNSRHFIFNGNDDENGALENDNKTKRYIKTNVFLMVQWILSLKLAGHSTLSII
jgi:hypothetical protein